jgi:signal transduction histidine kinase/ligand-binding sensor domain-containing protein/DNA-binding NarL/FixJ family response regulator
MQSCLSVRGSNGTFSWLYAWLVMSLTIQSFPGLSQPVRSLSTKDGLPQSFVSGLVQDDTSFIWIGTRNGMARYDGIQYKLFQHDPHDSNTLASNIVIWIRMDNKNQLCIEYEGGEIDELNPVTEKVRHLLKGNLPTGGGVLFVRRGWLVDENGIFWGIAKGEGLNSYNSRTNQIMRFTHLSSGLPSDTIRGLVESKNKTIWILSQQGISQYNQHTKQFTHIPLPVKQDFNDYPQSDAEVIDLHERKNGELMWGDRRRIFFFDPTKRTFRTIPLLDLPKCGIRWIRTSSEGMEYFESNGKVYDYDDAGGLKPISKSNLENFGDATSFLIDRSGVVWIGTNAAGIRQIDLGSPFFESFAYKKDFCSDLLQQELRLNSEQMFEWTDKDNQFSPAGYHFRSVYDANRRLYIALKETVCYYDPGQKKFIKLPHVPVITGPQQLGIGIKGITIGSKGSPMIVGYNGNVMQYDSSAKIWTPFLDPSLIRKTYGPIVLPQDILADEKNIWITTADDGLLKIDIQTKQLQALKKSPAPGSLPTDQLLGLRADPSRPNLLWIGSYQGLICLDKNSMKCELFALKEGLPDNTIYSILTDHNANLWLSTNKGICRFDPITHQVRAFNTLHGLPGDEFNRFHQLELPDGRLAFGGTQGWTIFDPLSIKNDDYDPIVAFTELKVNNKEVNSAKGQGPLSLPLNALNQIRLSYEQNTISIGFAGLEFSQPQDLQYRYRLEGYDDDWVNAGNSHQANYTKIPPGSYTLTVDASNTSERWSPYVRTIKIRIDAPWWSTRMAYLCYCIILAGLAWTFIRLRVRQMVLKEEMVLKEKEAIQLKELDDMKSRFFSNITHEFRTPLTLIMGPAEQLKQNHSNDPQQSRMADIIVSNAKQLLTLINRLMDLSKLEANALQLHEQKGYPADVVGSVIHSFESNAESKKINLSFDNQMGQLNCLFFADAIERIVYNLVSNALKFTRAGGRVVVSLSARGEHLHLVVQDSGIGISQNDIAYIFDRFYQAHENPLTPHESAGQGTGIGLSLVKELVNQMKGTIEVQSTTEETGRQGSGTIFTLDLPFRSDAGETVVAPLAQTPDTSLKDLAEASDMPAQILLVEDSAELANFIAGILSEHYQVTQASNGAMALDLGLSLMPDLIISDVMMPVMNGYELCGHLKADIRTSHIPIILLTAKVSQENLMEGLQKGADDYLTKPFHPSELLLRIHNLLDRQKKLTDRVRKELGSPESSKIENDGEPLPQDIFITRLYEVLEGHLDDSLFGVDQLVGVMNMSRSSLHRKLKAITGLSTTEVVRNYRLKRSTYFLKEGFSSSDTAYKSGFGSPAYFTKSFREVYGVTPGEYVRQLKK